MCKTNKGGARARHRFVVKGDVFSTSLAQYPELVFIPVLKATQVGIANKLSASMLLLIVLDIFFDLDEKAPMMPRENSELFGHITQVTVDQRIAKLVGEVSEERLKEIVRHLSTYYTRLSTSGTGMFVWVLGSILLTLLHLFSYHHQHHHVFTHMNFALI